MLSVVEDDTRLAVEGGKVIITTDAKGAQARSELSGADAKRLAIKYAAEKGVPDPRINGSITVYAVDRKGKEIEDLSKAGEATGFRADVPVTQRIL